MINVTELRPGNYFIDEGNLYQVIDILLNKTAMRKMVAKVKVKNMRTGAITELARNSGYGVEDVRIDKKLKARLENEIPFLAPNGEVTIVSYEEEVLGVVLPAKVALTVTECEPGVRGDTVSNGGSKDAVLETGLSLRVPLFINQGDKISVDTSTGKYDGRA